MVDITHSDFLTTIAERFAATLGLAHSASFAERLALTVPRSAPEAPITHLPDNYEKILALSDEQKALLAAGLASGCDAVAYYTPVGRADGNAFALNKHIDIYPQTTEFAPALVYPPPENTPYLIPVYADGHIKGIVALHASTTPADLAEPEYCRDAKLKMAGDILKEHADLFGISGKILQSREQAHRTLPRKQQFFMTLTKDMFSTFTHVEANGIGAGDLTQVKEAQDAYQLKAALRRAGPLINDSDQYTHTLGVSDMMEHALTRAVNGDPVKPVMNAEQSELMILLALLHDVGKTQLPSQAFTDWKPADPSQVMANERFMTSRNGSHPYFTAVMLSLYPQEGLDAGSHHHGLARYGAEEQASVKKKLGPNFTEFTEMTGGDIHPSKIPPLAKILRVADVTETVTGRVDKPLHEAILQLGTLGQANNPKDLYNKVRLGADGKPLVTPDTVDPDYTCFLLANGVFEAYGEQRTRETGGWQDKKGQPKYDPEKLASAKQKILHDFGWDNPEIRQAKEHAIRQAITRDPLLRENSATPQRTQPHAQWGL